MLWKNKTWEEGRDQSLGFYSEYDGKASGGQMYDPIYIFTYHPNCDTGGKCFRKQ